MQRNLAFMIVFYATKKSVITLQETLSCSSTCNAKCIKPKSKCCYKYKKKGINCKRCPNILLKTAS